MKKLLSVLLALCLMFVFTLPTFAAGVDDGTIEVVQKGETKFFGTEITSGCVKYVAASGADNYFYDLSGDKDMDICDLVALNNNSTDLDLSGSFDNNDAKTMRLLLIGAKNQKGDM